MKDDRKRKHRMIVQIVVQCSSSAAFRNKKSHADIQMHIIYFCVFGYDQDGKFYFSITIFRIPSLMHIPIHAVIWDGIRTLTIMPTGYNVRIWMITIYRTYRRMSTNISSRILLGQHRTNWFKIRHFPTSFPIFKPDADSAERDWFASSRRRSVNQLVRCCLKLALSFRISTNGRRYGYQRWPDRKSLWVPMYSNMYLG